MSRAQVAAWEWACEECGCTVLHESSHRPPTGWSFNQDDIFNSSRDLCPDCNRQGGA